MDNNQKEQEVPDIKNVNPKVLQIVHVCTRLANSKWNVVIFRDDPWLYIQYYIGLFLQMPTILIIRKTDKYFAKRLKHDLLKHIILVDEFDEADSKVVADLIASYVKGAK